MIGSREKASVVGMSLDTWITATLTHERWAVHRSLDIAASWWRRCACGSSSSEARGFDIDAVTEEDLAMPARPLSPVTMNDLDRIIGSSDLMPPGTDIQPMGHREYGLLAPGMTERLRVTTDPEYFEEHAESLELWSPGNPLFNPPEFLGSAGELSCGGMLKDILDE